MKKPNFLASKNFKNPFKKSASNNINNEETLPTISEDCSEELTEESEQVVPQLVEQKVEPVVIIDSDEVIINRGKQLINDINSSFNGRMQGTKNEREVANLLLNKSEEVFKVKGALEPFYVHKMAYNLGFMVISAILLVALITFAFSPITALLLFIIATSLVVFRVAFKKNVSLKCDRAVSFNVTNKLKDNKENTLIIMSNYSTSRNQNINRFFSVNLKALLISYSIISFLTFLFLVLLSAGIFNVGLQVMVGLMLCVLIAFFASFYGFEKKQNNNVKNGLEGVGVGFMIVDYLSQHSELVGENTNVMFCSLGGGADGTNGAKAFVKQHFKNNGDLNNAVVLSINSASPSKLTLYSKKGISGLTNKVYETLSKYNVSKQRPLIKGIEATVLAGVGVECCSIGESQLVMDKNFNTINDRVVNETALTESFNKHLKIVTDLLNELKEI